MAYGQRHVMLTLVPAVHDLIDRLLMSYITSRANSISTGCLPVFSKNSEGQDPSGKGHIM